MLSAVFVAVLFVSTANWRASFLWIVIVTICRNLEFSKNKAGAADMPAPAQFITAADLANRLGCSEHT